MELSYENFITSGPDPHPPPIVDDESDDDDDDDIPRVSLTKHRCIGATLPPTPHPLPAGMACFIPRRVSGPHLPNQEFSGASACWDTLSLPH